MKPTHLGTHKSCDEAPVDRRDAVIASINQTLHRAEIRELEIVCQFVKELVREDVPPR